MTKGILLSNRNFNALAAQIIATNPFFRPGHKMLAIMPMFHGFGLGVSIHSMVVLPFLPDCMEAKSLVLTDGGESNFFSITIVFAEKKINTCSLPRDRTRQVLIEQSGGRFC
mgnify:CR=1 FL=1